jgi:hypothetical protein
MATETVEVTTAEGSGKPRRKRAQRSKVRSRRSTTARRSRNANLRSQNDQVLRQGRRVIDRAYDWAGEATSAMPRFRDLRLPRRSDLSAITEANPLLLGAVGLGLGIVLGSLMPSRFSARSASRLSQPTGRGGRRGRRSS